jgi:flagellar basal body P-ring formation protein FlgA
MSSHALWLRATVVVAMLAGSACMLHAQAAPLARDQRRIAVAIATRALVTGDTLAASDFAVTDTVVTWRWSSAPDTTRPVAGWIARRPIAVGEVLRAPAVVAPPVVMTGSSVTAIWQEGGVRLVLKGIATNNAAVGAPVGVRLDRNRRLDGIAIGPNTVRLR